MKVTAPGLIRSTGVAAIAAGLLFVVIQPIHPPDTLASVTTGAWSAIHQATLLMTILFLAGITGIYASQVEESGWLGLAGYVALSLGLMITAGFVFIEAFVEPLLATAPRPSWRCAWNGRRDADPGRPRGPAHVVVSIGRPVPRRLHRVRNRHQAGTCPVARCRGGLRLRVYRVGAHFDRARFTQAHRRADRHRPRMARLRALVAVTNASRVAPGHGHDAASADDGCLGGLCHHAQIIDKETEMTDTRMPRTTGVQSESGGSSRSRGASYT